MRKKRVKGAYLEYHSRGAKHEDKGREVKGYQRKKPAYLEYHSRTNKHQDIGRQARSRRGIRPSMSTRGEREASADRPIGEKRRYKRDSKGRFA